MMLFAGWVLIKVVKGIFIVLSLFFYTGNDKRPPTHTKNKESIAKSEETTIENTSIPVENKEPVIENTSIPIEDSEPVVKNKEPVVENKEPVIENKKTLVESKESAVKNSLVRFKYENEVYKSFVNKVYNAFEAYKSQKVDRQRVFWETEDDGFTVVISSAIKSSEVYKVNVCYDKDNLLGLKDPYYIKISYSFSFENREFDRYKEISEYINDYYYTHNMLDKDFYIVHEVGFTEKAQMSVYFCYIFLTNKDLLSEMSKKYGDEGSFAILLKTAKNKYVEGLELYRTRY